MYRILILLGLLFLSTNGSADDSAVNDHVIAIPVQDTDHPIKQQVRDTLTLVSLNMAHGRKASLNQLFVGHAKIKNNLLDISGFLNQVNADSLEKMPGFFSNDFNTSWVRLAHERGNLTSKNAVTGVKENLKKNPNSISTIGYQVQSQLKAVATVRIVSPYFFVPRYADKNGKEIWDGVKKTFKWLDENPNGTIELITNSVLTSDNFIAQAVIDMDTELRLLLTPEMLDRWLSGLDEGEFNPGLVESDEWIKLINHSHLRIYQTGRLDSVQIGGGKHYGKLHAKFLINP